MQGCSDCEKQRPFVKIAKFYENDTNLYECDCTSCTNRICRRHVHSLKTLGDFCGDCTEVEKQAMKEWR